MYVFMVYCQFNRKEIEMKLEEIFKLGKVETILVAGLLLSMSSF